MSRDERVILGLIIGAVVLHTVIIAFWNFTHYDPLWVYGYQGRLYTLRGYISPTIGYYPQFIQLQYAYLQIMTGSGINDHIARAMIPFLHLASILAAYTLGQRLFNRRIGVFLAGLWALYPHVGQWSYAGDLEIPLTMGFTSAAACLLSAWFSTERRERRHYALLAGLFLGITMWTKPTGGAFILGVILLVILEVARHWPIHDLHETWRKFYPRFEVAVITGVASIPLGALWYARNGILGHDPLPLPNPFWPTQALQSGAEFGWPWLALTLLLLSSRFWPERPNWRSWIIGYGLICLALIPTLLRPYEGFNDPTRMGVIEWALLILGSGIIAFSLRPYARLAPITLRKIGWAYALAFPYFVVWFQSYSYHYRLSFAIVPLLALPTAVILSAWLEQWRTPVLRLALIAIASVGIFLPLHLSTPGWDWLWSNELPDDDAKLEVTNTALLWTVKTLRDLVADHPDAVIVAPGLERLPFFFPLMDIRIHDTPIRLSELEGVDYFIYTQESAWRYPELDLPSINQVTGSMSRTTALVQVGGHSDANFFSRIFFVQRPQRRFLHPREFSETDQTVLFGDFAQFMGHRLPYEARLSTDQDTLLLLIWKGIRPAANDYKIYVHLLNEQGEQVAVWDDMPLRGETINGQPMYYTTLVWEQDEYIVEERLLRLPAPIPPGRYSLRIGMYDLYTEERLTLQIGEVMSDGYTLSEVIEVE
ncbi:MAG: glycosyltransferase family 39 protein [Anaerolineae bacterium]|nr:glycosyltransferase family 39 protein [Anaerolineae bacterium]